MRHFSVFFIIILIQTGYYLYVESSGTTPGQTTPGQRAELVSPWLLGRPGGRCLKFYYFMYGKIVGSLAVKLTLSDGRNWYSFHKHKDQGKDWKKGIGNIDPPTGLRYRVSIYRKFLLSVVEVILVDLIQLELLS